MVIFNFFAAGYIILILAIIVNVLANKIGLHTWYDLIKNPKKTSIVSIIWLVWFNPFTLGLSGYFAVSIVF